MRLVAAPLLALALLPATARAQAEAPLDVDGTGGARYGAAGLRAAAFSVAPGRVTAGAPLTISVRVVGPARRVRARVALVARGRRAGVLRLGRMRTGATVTRRWTPRVRPGSYVARLSARAGDGRRLVRTPSRSGAFPVTVVAAPAPTPCAASVAGVFPVRGDWSFGGPESRFGAARNGHVHQGQDVFAAEGTPLVSPVAGSVFWRRVQPAGAGHYLVIRDAGGVDYVFMHLVAGSERVDRSDVVRAGQPIGQVGHTGDARGSHLHFELWPDGWYAAGAKPVDPLPQLRAWASEA